MTESYIIIKIMIKKHLIDYREHTEVIKCDWCMKLSNEISGKYQFICAHCYNDWVRITEK